MGRAVGLDNAGTVEFLLDAETGAFYFIEVNPRIQVEHTVTETVTGFDIVKTQILIAQGQPLSDPEIGLGSQDAVRAHGFAMQCRVTTEDPAKGFAPDYGRISAYRSASGVGIRLDAGTAFGGAVITPFYDSLLVKVTAHGLRFLDATRHMERCLQEFRVRGVHTNLPFLMNLVTHPAFLAYRVTTRFIDDTPELFELPERQDRASKLLQFLAEVTVNGNPEVRAREGEPGKKGNGPIRRERAPVPALSGSTSPYFRAYSRQDWQFRPTGNPRHQFLRELGPEKFAAWVRGQKRLLITDTTMRDAHQSLLATRMRTYDMLQIAPWYARRLNGLFSLEMWGGATFDVAMRFLKESPWDRLARLRERIPNILFQMLLRAASAVGYTNYPDNVVKTFIRESAQAGIDLFRIFDALNWLPNLRPAIESVREAGKIAEAAVCYTGDILDPKNTRYTLRYYVDLAKELEKAGATMLAIKDMAGLCKPYAARTLVRALRQEIGIPIHFHTHDSAGGQMASLLLAAQEGVDVVDCAMASMSGVTSQPSMYALTEALRFQPRDTGLDREAMRAADAYWQAVRGLYSPFETGQLAPAGDVYQNEMPGGQYTNLYAQAAGLGLADRWREVCRKYAEVNRMFGDVVKVTPSSKVVGDMALFMVGNNLTPADVVDGPGELAFPESVVEFFEGRLGEPPGGFPEKLQKRVLRGRQPIRGRPGAALPPADFNAAKADLQKRIGRPVNDREVVTQLLYPRVFPEYAEQEADLFGRECAADAGVLPRHGAGRRDEYRHRARQDIDSEIPDRRRRAVRRQPHGVPRTKRPAARDGGDG